MDQKDFIIASRYHVRPALHAVSDNLLQTEVRLEARLMKLLCILAKHSGQLVTREQLVKEIWDDYGGGEDGLTHAISSLRKLLNDSSKEMIETIPKKGYILQAEITALCKQNAAVSGEKKLRQRPALFAYLGLLAAAVLAGFVYFSVKSNKDSALLSKAKKMEVPFDKVNKRPEETWLNTITTVGEDSTQYKLHVIGDRRPELYINGRLVSPDEMEKHLDLIHNLKSQLQERNSN